MNDDVNEIMHNLLFDRGIEGIEVAYLKALKKNIDCPVVFLLELSDPFARSLLQPLEKDKAINRTLRTARKSKHVATTTWYIPATLARSLLREKTFNDKIVLDNWHEYSELLAPHHFPVVVIGAGIISLSILPKPESDE